MVVDKELDKDRTDVEDFWRFRGDKSAQSSVKVQHLRFQASHPGSPVRNQLYQAQVHQGMPHFDPRGIDKPPECQPH